jgi:RNA-directed DNA polymerase
MAKVKSPSPSPTRDYALKLKVTFCVRGVISPLLANLLLDDLDKELEKRGHRFCRYADDCNIYVRSQPAGERVMTSITAFLEGKLKLRVNRQKSAVAPVKERQFLGHRLTASGQMGIAPKSLKRAKDRLRRITRRNRGISLDKMIGEVNSFATGWVMYYRHAQCQSVLRDLDGWLRRKLRCVRLKHCKRTQSIANFLMGNGVMEVPAWTTALSGKGWWRLALSPSASLAMDNKWFDKLGLTSLAHQYAALNPDGNRRIR